MTDNSKIVLHWEIDNASATLATGKAKSGVFYEGGFKWTAEVTRAERVDNPNDWADFNLRCDVDHAGPWKCEANVHVYVLHSSSGFDHWMRGHSSFDDGNRNKTYIGDLYYWSTLISPGYTINDNITVEFRIEIISSEGSEWMPDLGKFIAPNRMSNVILKIGEEKLHVSKELLAVHSPVFETLFFGDFAEKGKEEVEIKDVVYEEFVDVLNLIYPGVPMITDRTVHHIMKLADQFQLEGVLKLSNAHLMKSSKLDAAKKLLLADQYRLVALRDHTLQSFTSVHDVKQKLKSSPEYANFSADMKAAICDRIMDLNLQ